jgi:DNA-binding IclR family transcriptional regulator
MPVKPSPAVLRTADVLEWLARTPREPQSLSDVARGTGISKATCNALLLGLAQAGLVIRHVTTQRYSLGPMLITLGEAATTGYEIAEQARPAMDQLGDALLLPVLAAVAAGTRLVVVASTTPPRPFAVPFATGQSIPMVPPLGAAFAAWSGETAVRDWLQRAPQPLNGDEIAHTRQALALIRDLGYSVTLDNQILAELRSAIAALSAHPQAEEVRARRDRLIRSLAATGYLPTSLDAGSRYRVIQVSAPVFDHNGELAMTILVSPHGLDLDGADVRDLGTATRACADRITRTIGGVRPSAA